MKIWKRLSLVFVLAVMLMLLPHQALAAEEEYAGLRQELIQAIRNHEEELELTDYQISVEDFSALYADVLEKEQGMWHVYEQFGYQASGVILYRAYFYYEVDAEEAQAIRAVANTAISSCIKSGMSDVQKALALHDWLVLHNEYDLTYSKYSAYDALVTGSSVCQGYAEAYEILLDMVGIDSCVVSSEGMNHAWNLVEIGGEWYHVDTTWDDPLIYGMDVPGNVYHDHFLRSDEGIRQEEHYGWETDIACTSTAYDHGMYWEGSHSAVWFLSNEEILLRRDGMGSVVIVRKNLQTGVEAPVYENHNSSFEYAGSLWYTSSCGLTLDNGILYFGDLTHIYRLNGLSGEPEVVCQVSDLGDWHYFMGSYVENGMLYAMVRSMASDAMEVRSLRIEEAHTHLWDDGVITKEPTQESEGTVIYTCTQCGETKTESIPKLEHVHSYEAAVTAPTCVASGYTTYTCSCGDSYRNNYMDPLPHTPGEPVETDREEPSCLMDGSHILAYYCTQCGNCINEVWEPIPAPGHIYIDTSREPTCTEYGWEEQTCKVCGSIETLCVLEPLGHVKGTTKNEVLQERSCTMQGVVHVTASCKRCGDMLVDEIVTYDPYPHIPGEPEVYVSKEPWCETPGERVVIVSCQDCNAFLESEINVIPALEHDYRHYVEQPTCQMQGSTTHTCQRCLYSYADSYVDMVDHSWDEWSIVKDPDHLENGLKERTCTYCLTTQTEEILNNPFTDVGDGNRFKTQILWAYYEGITSGKTATTFEPNAEVTRAQFVTFLWKAAGSPEPKSQENPFEDVTSGNRFLQAILWAYHEGITAGTTDTTFSPNNTCTRGQVVMFLYRYAGSPEIRDMENPFGDVSTGNRFRDAILWAYSNGITTGKTETTFDIGGACTRAQVVTFLYRYLA